MIYIIDNDMMMAECIAGAVCSCFDKDKSEDVKFFQNAIEAMQEIAEADVSEIEMIFLDIMLDGPDGFTFLNELQSYGDTAQIPIVIVTALKIKADLSDYGVVGLLDKSTMQPDDICALVCRHVPAVQAKDVSHGRMSKKLKSKEQK